MTDAQPASNAQLQELQETVSRLTAHKGVHAVMILSRSGDILVESGAVGPRQAVLTKKLMEAANDYLKSLAPEDEVSFVQVRSKDATELMIAPHDGFVLAVLKR